MKGKKGNYLLVKVDTSIKITLVPFLVYGIDGCTPDWHQQF
jgi:hypothetical protein